MINDHVAARPASGSGSSWRRSSRPAGPTPEDDMISDLVQAEVVDDDGTTRRLTDEECRQLRQPPGQRRHRDGGPPARLGRGDPRRRTPTSGPSWPPTPALLPNAVEELLRYEAPSPVQGRWTMRDVELHGEVVPKDSIVLLLTGSAGRDERTYPDAERFDIHRTFDNHVSFGYGIHFCIGAALARMEGRIALEEVLARFPEWTVDHDGRRPAPHLHGAGLDQRPRGRLGQRTDVASRRRRSGRAGRSRRRPRRWPTRRTPRRCPHDRWHP